MRSSFSLHRTTRERVTTPNGTRLSYSRTGEGPPLVLVHGSFSDDVTNWELVEPILCESFSLYAIARRGRGATDATTGHAIEDEARDVMAVLESLGEPAFLLGHSYGAHCALAAAALAPRAVRKLVLYEAPFPGILSRATLARLEALAFARDWGAVAFTFFRDSLRVPVTELEALRESALWPSIVADAEATLEDLRALARYDFDPERFANLAVPVLLQVGSESPRPLYVTDALAATLPNSRIQGLPGQAHEGMTTAPEMYAEAVTRFLLL